MTSAEDSVNYEVKPDLLPNGLTLPSTTYPKQQNGLLTQNQESDSLFRQVALEAIRGIQKRNKISYFLFVSIQDSSGIYRHFLKELKGKSVSKSKRGMFLSYRKIFSKKEKTPILVLGWVPESDSYQRRVKKWLKEKFIGKYGQSKKPSKNTKQTGYFEVLNGDCTVIEEVVWYPECPPNGCFGFGTIEVCGARYDPESIPDSDVDLFVDFDGEQFAGGFGDTSTDGDDHCDSQSSVEFSLECANEDLFNEVPCAGNPIKNPTITPTKKSGTKGGRFGKGRGRQHNGLDISGPVGAPIYPLRAGRVVYLYKNHPSNFYDPESYGNFVIIEVVVNGRKKYFRYNHLKDVHVSRGQSVTASTQIGTLGKTGNANSKDDPSYPHVDINVYEASKPFGKPENRKYENPEPYLKTKFNFVGNPINPC